MEVLWELNDLIHVTLLEMCLHMTGTQHILEIIIIPGTAKWFTWINSPNPHKSSVSYILLPHFIYYNN